MRSVSAYSSWGRLPNCHKLAAITCCTTENQGTLTCWFSFCPRLEAAKDILTLPGVLPQLAKWERSGAPSSPRYSQSSQGDRVRRGTRPASQATYHPWSESSHCCSTDGHCVTANLNLILNFCLNAGPPAPSGRSLYTSLIVLCISKMHTAGEKNPKPYM